MSITILQQPNDLALARSPMIYSVSGTNVSQDNYKYIADVFVWEGGTGDKPSTATFRISKRPDNINNLYGYFDISKIVESEMFPTFTEGTTPIHFNPEISPNTKTALNVQVSFGETYSSGGVTILTSGITTSTEIYSLDGYYPTSVNSYNFDLSPLKSLGALTNRPTSLYTYSNGKMTLPIYLDTARDVRYLKVVYSNGTTVVDDFTDFLSASITDESDWAMAFVPMGPYNLNNSVITVPPVLISDLRYYDFVLLDNSSDPVTSTYRVYVECTPKYTPDEIAFQNSYGAWDYIPILGSTKITTQGDKDTFSNLAPAYGNSTIVYQPHQKYRQTYNHSIKTTYSVNTGFLPEAYSPLFVELLNSSNVQLVSNRRSIVITDTSYEYKTSLNDRLINYTINFEMSQDENQQRWL